MQPIRSGNIEKTTHFGRAAEFFIMSELLLRGWNVAIPVVDIGDDVFIIDDNDKTTWRIQVKAARGERDADNGYRAQFSLSRAQLKRADNIELFFVFLVRLDERWRFLVIAREELHRIRQLYIDNAQEKPVRGRPPIDDDEAKSGSLGLTVTIDSKSAKAWGESLDEFLDTWPEALAPVEDGPGTRRSTTKRS